MRRWNFAPPRRDTLLPLAACSPLKPKEASAEATPKNSAVAEHDSSDGDVVAVPGCLHNAEVAEQLNKFLCKFTQDRQYIGISAFVLFALRYRKRVQIWFDMKKSDVLAMLAPWATSVITDVPSYHAISCKVLQGETFHCTAIGCIR